MAALKCSPYGCKCLTNLTKIARTGTPYEHSQAFLVAMNNGHKKPEIQAARAAGKGPAKFSIHSF